MQQPNISKLKNHPLFQDSQFIPNDLNHFICEQQANEEIGSELVIPVENDDITLMDIQSRIMERVQEKKDKMFSTILLQSVREPQRVQNHRAQLKGTLSNYKRNNGRRKESVAVFKWGREKQMAAKEHVQQFNMDRYEICVIMLGQFTVFTVTFQWSPKIQISQELIKNINKAFSCDLSSKDVEIRGVEIDVIPDKNYCGIRYNRLSILTEVALESMILGQRQPVYVGIDINNTKFKNKEPDRSLLRSPEQKMYNMGPKVQIKPFSSISVEDIREVPHRNLVVQVELQAIRLDYDDVKNYKIKFLLGILKVPNYDRRGIMVLNKLFKPDDEVNAIETAFQLGNDINFVHAKISTESELFFSQVNGQTLMAQKELKLILQASQNQPNKYPFIQCYLNNARYPKDHNQLQLSVNFHIKDLINNYFISSSMQRKVIWSRYVRNMMKEYEKIDVFKGWAYRVVGYQYQKKELESIVFKNFLVATKNIHKIRPFFKNKYNRVTIFKIKSVSGRAAKNLSPFQMDQVIFSPYSSFTIIRKTESKQSIEYEIQELPKEQTVSKVSLLIWVDDKLQEGRSMFNQMKRENILYPIYFFQVSSNAQFQHIVEKSHPNLFNSKFYRTIVISNMKRREQGQVVDNAGVKTHQHFTHLFPEQIATLIYYIGYIEGTKQKLRQSEIDPQSCVIVNDFISLKEKLMELCNWEDMNKPKVESPFLLRKHKSWSNIFASNLL